MMPIHLSKSWTQFEHGKTISDVEFEDDFLPYFEMYTHTFLEHFKKVDCINVERLAQALEEVIEFEAVGGFLAEPKDQLDLLAAFGLVLMDRIAKLGYGRLDHRQCFYLHEQLFECFDYVQQGRASADTLRRAASERHKENRELKAEAFAWLDQNMMGCKTMQVAAEKLKKVVPMSYDTRRVWVTEWKKIRSASRT